MALILNRNRMYDNFKVGISIDTEKVSMEIRELRAFTIVAEELNFRRAADRLGMSQPPLTRLISQLEISLGVILFTRSTRAVELTGAGLHLLKKSRAILEEVEKTESEMRALNRSKTGKLILSLSTPAIHSVIPRLITSFKQQFPKVNVELMENPLTTIERNLRTGKIDMAFGVNEFHSSSIEQTDIQTHELGVIIPSENPLSKKKIIELHDLEGETLIFHGKHENLGFQADFLKYLNMKKISVNVYYKKPKERCGDLVVENRGILMTSRLFAPWTKGVVYVPFKGYSKKIKVLASWSSENHSVHLQALINFLEANAQIPHSSLDSHLA